MTEKVRGRPPKGTEVISIRVSTDVGAFLRDFGNGDASVGASRLLSELSSAQTDALHNIAHAASNLDSVGKALLTSMSAIQSEQRDILKAMSLLLSGDTKGDA